MERWKPTDARITKSGNTVSLLIPEQYRSRLVEHAQNQDALQFGEGENALTIKFVPELPQMSNK